MTLRMSSGKTEVDLCFGCRRNRIEVQGSFMRLLCLQTLVADSMGDGSNWTPR
jgi:hypothetical protein